jgi:hypothetical protein
MASVDNPTPAEPDATAQPSTPPSDLVTTPEGADRPPTENSITTGPDAPSSSEPEPAKSATEVLREASHHLEMALAVIVVLFAFLVASFRAANSDFLRHVAVGRLITEGNYSFGKEPFTWTAADKQWINTSWLFDLLGYLLYQGSETGAITVVVLKAAGVAFMALLMLAVARSGGRSLLLPAACVGLAILVFSPSAQVRPSCLSAVFLAATLWLLRHPQALRKTSPAGQGTCTRSFWLLVPLFALWANLDAWFILGPITTALYLLGEWAASRNPALADMALSQRDLRTLAIALGVGVVACCLGPFHVQAFLTLPTELTPGSVDSHPVFAEWFLSPLSSHYFDPSAGLSVAGMAYFALLLLGALSFVLEARGPGGVARLLNWQLFVWLAFAILSLYRATTIGFFAVVAGPITALNLSGWFARRPQVEESKARLQGAVAVRCVAVFLAVVAVVATFPGWLQASPHAARRVGWGMDIDRSLEHAAQQAHRWREANLVSADVHWLTLSPDATNYLAWYAPGARGFVDDRLGLFRGNLARLTSLRRALAQGPGATTAAEADGNRAESWTTFFRDNRTDFVFLSQAARPRPLASLEQDQSVRIILARFATPGEMTLCYLDGNAVIFGWKGTQPESDPFTKLRTHFAREAFGAAAGVLPEAPQERAPETQPWYTELWQAPPVDDPAGEEAGLHVARFKRLMPFDRKRITDTRVSPMQLGALLLSQDNVGTFHHLSTLQLATAMLAWGDPGVLNTYYARLDHGPPELLILAIRRARQAIAANPTDAIAHVNLAEAYHVLWHQTRESIGPPEIGEIRRIQVIAEATAALRLGLPPGRAGDAHAMILQSVPYLDVRVRHFRGIIESMHAAGRGSNDAESFDRQMQAGEEELAKLTKELEYQRNNFDNNQAGKSLLDRADLALKVGLAEKAIEVLQGAKVEELMDRRGQMPGRDMLVQLLLNTGQPEQVGDLLDPRGEAAQARGGAQLSFYNLLRFAAQGDYAQAKKVLEGTPWPQQSSVRFPLARLEAEMVLRGALESRAPVTQLAIVMRRIFSTAELVVTSGNTINNARLLHAWLALEEGNIAQTKQDLEVVQQLMPGKYTPPGHQNLYQCLQEWLARGDR